MGMNYYARINYCEKCGRADKIHIGKSSSGWTFLFSGHDIISYKNWLDFLNNKNVKIVDEHETVITLAKFRSIVEDRQNSKYKVLQDYYDYCLQHYPDMIHHNIVWRDLDGYSFDSSYFK